LNEYGYSSNKTSGTFRKFYFLAGAALAAIHHLPDYYGLWARHETFMRSAGKSCCLSKFHVGIQKDEEEHAESNG
jgi:hypothetical protein